MTACVCVCVCVYMCVCMCVHVCHTVPVLMVRCVDELTHKQLKCALYLSSHLPHPHLRPRTAELVGGDTFVSGACVFAHVRNLILVMLGIKLRK